MKLKLLSLGLAGLFVANGAMAVTETFEASVTVQNTLELTEDQPLNFGVIRATPHGSTSNATLLINPNGTSAPLAENPTDDGDLAAIQILEDGTPATFTVGGAASFAQLTVTFPADGDVELSTGAPNSSGFPVTDFSGYVSIGANPGSTFSTTETITATSDGELSFNVGAILSTDDDSEVAYNDGDYKGSYTITVDY